MKRFLSLFLAVGFSGFALAGGLPSYLSGTVTGELVNSVFTREHLELQPGKVVDCVRKDVPPYLTSFRCKIEGVTARVFQTGGKSIDIKLDSLVAFDKNHKGGFFREYNFTGTSSEGPIALLLWHYNRSPQAIKGHIKFENLGLVVPVVATQP